MSVIDVPFGAGQAAVNLLGGRIEGVVQLPPAVIAQVKGGDLRVLAALGSQRDRIFPETPTASEEVFPVASIYGAVSCPRGTPTAVIKKLEETIRSCRRIARVPGCRQESRLLASILVDDDSEH